MSSNDPPRRTRWLRLVALAALAAALALGWWLRGCPGMGLGTGAGGLLSPAPDTEAPDPTPAPAETPPPRPCELYLDSGGLTLDGAPVDMDQAVHACRTAGKARLRATGGARAGAYDALIHALDQAGVPVEPN